MLSLRNIVKVYETAGESVRALDGVELHFRHHEFVSILGPSGCGKTTLLNIIGGLDRYTEGDLSIRGVSTSEYTDRDWDSYRNHSIGFVFQSYHLIPHQSVLANVELALTLSGVSKEERRRRAKEALIRVGLGDQMRKRPGQMSGGQMQRVAIARALVNNPDILLADEPTGALDTTTSKQIMDLLAEVAQDRLVIMVTHNPELAEEYSSRIIRLLDGKVISDSHPLSEEEAKEQLSLYQATPDKPADAPDATDEASLPKAKKQKGKKPQKTSMSLWTAITLSFNNLLTKKTRSILTSFAGSIGIIGIALILALSNGIQLYIDRVEEDALSSYPLTLESVTMDMNELLATFTGNSQGGGDHEDGYIYSSPAVLQLMEAVRRGVRQNDLASFKAYLESEDCGIKNNDVATVTYVYNVTPQIWTTYHDSTNNKDILVQANPSHMMQMLLQGSPGTTSMIPGGLSLFSQMLDNPDLLNAQYDVLEGEWPDAYNEVVLVADSHSEINDLFLYGLGIKNPEELSDIVYKISKGQQVSISTEKFSYEDLMGKTFTMMLTGDMYAPDANGIYIDQRDNKDFINNLMGKADQPDSRVVTLTISGIIRPKKDAAATSISGVVGYTAALTDYLLEQAPNTDVVKAQMARPDIDVTSGLPFASNVAGTMTDEEKLTQIKSALASAGLSTAYIKSQWKELLPLTMPETQAAVAYTKLTQFLQANGYHDENTRVTKKVSLMAITLAAHAEEAAEFLGQNPDIPLTPEMLQDPQKIIEPLLGAYLFGAITEAKIDQMTLMVLGGFGHEEIGIPSLEEAIATRYTEIDAMDDVTVKAQYDIYLTTISDATYLTLWQERFEKTSDGSYEDNLVQFGMADKDNPSAIYIYPVSFDQKAYVEEQIALYNEDKEEKDQIVYTDYIGVLFSSISLILNIITYVLVAFVAISLVVSSIMIGIITYISVLERTKEIGILRAVGASKRDISRVFNAETLMIGFVAGLMGIIATLILIVPINAIIRALAGVSNIGASLPAVAAIVLVLISMSLTVVSGLIPSRVAAKKDPVEALRTE